MSESSSEEEKAVDTIMEVQSVESSEDPPKDQWSSLILVERGVNKKKELFKKGLFSPPSEEICGKYIAMSDSSVLRHPYYNYPAVKDPGIEEALLGPPIKVIYPDDGQEVYLAFCKEMDQCVVRLFYEGLLTNEINLSYYCVDPRGVRAMGRALKYNKTVKTFNLTENFLTRDACYHLGEMLTSNATLYELNLTACRIGPVGLKQLLQGLLTNRTLMILNLSRNALTDTGGEHIARAIEQGLSVKQISLKANELGSITATAMADALDFFNTFSHVDLSWNNFFSPIGTLKMISLLNENSYLQELDLSWNTLMGPKLAGAIRTAMLAPNLRVLKLNNNNFSGEDILILSENLTKAKKLRTFNLSFNPLAIEDANVLINIMKKAACKLQNLYLDNVDVDESFVILMDKIKRMKSKKNAVITFGNIIKKKVITGPDPREVILDRVEYVTKARKTKVDVAPIILQLVKDGKDVMDIKSFGDALKKAGATMMDANLIEAIADTFKGPKSSKMKLVNVAQLADYIKRKWPDRKLPTPPPKQEPGPSEPEEIAKGKDKGKGKKK